MASSIAAAPSRADEPASTALHIYPPTVGDCSVTIALESVSDLKSLRVLIDGHPIKRQLAQISPVVFRLDQPLDSDNEVAVEVAGVRYVQPLLTRPPGLPAPDVCAAQVGLPRWERRKDFEPTAYAGLAIDNFAPAAVVDYGPTTADPVESRSVGGVHVDVRGAHSNGYQVQFWVSAITMNGVRSADINCHEASHAALCGDFNAMHAPEQFVRAIEHASTLEAHFDPRLEFFTVNGNSQTPLRLFVGGQLGFYALEGGDRVYGSYDVNVGATAASGPFRQTTVSWGFGKTGLFSSDPGWNRLKVRGFIIVDAFAGVRDHVPWLRYLGIGAWRGFMAISIDRSLHINGTIGPDTVQSYYGVAFDLDKALLP